MCLAIPAQIKSIEGLLAQVEMGGVRRTVSLALTPEAQVGDYVIVHVGFAISVLDEAEAQETLALLEATLGAESAEQVEPSTSALLVPGEGGSESPLAEGPPPADA